MRNIIVVLGMHRSGTSAVTRGLKVLGSEFGPELMPAKKGDNEKGFWEDLGIYQLNEKILQKIGSRWDAWADITFTDSLFNILSEEKEAAVELLSSRTEDLKIYAFKDPRTSILLPFWQLVFDLLENTQIRYLLSIRNPKSVANSLKRRNNFPEHKSYNLWLKYNYHTLKDLQEATFTVIDYDLLMSSPEQEILRLADSLAIVNAVVSDAALQEYARDFLTEDLRHSQYNLSDVFSLDQFPLAGRLYSYLYQIASGMDDRTTREQLLLSIEHYFAEQTANFDYLDRLETENGHLHQELNTRQGEMELLLQKTYSTQQAELKQQHEFDQEAKAQAVAYASGIEHLRGQCGELELQLKEAQDGVSILQTELHQCQEHNKSLKWSLEQVNQSYEELKSKHNNIVGDYAHFRHSSAEQLKQIYAKLHIYDRSLLGRWHALTERLYAVVRLRPRSHSYHRQIVSQANAYLGEHQVNPLDYVHQQGRIRLAMKVLSYTIRHPFSSLRLMSFYRLKKLIKTIFSNDRALANSWVDERFPDAPRNKHLILIGEDESLDTLALTFPKVDKPLVSVVIPVFNQYRTTISCLQALLQNSGDIQYEVIIGDDASTDITRDIKSRIDNIRVVRAKQNQGFLRNCNAAVSKAKGEYVVLLNNDTNVQPGWLKPLLEVIQLDVHVGLVGPKLLFEDGKLQEAGGIIWNDGSGWNYGRGQDVEQPEFNYLRETDYISGACIMFRKRIWDELGGFDETFCPAYYEDTDLAFQMRQKGLKVVYQPESMVVHFEGVSNGTNLSSGVKKHQVINQEKFIQKWRLVLEKEHFPNAENFFQARDRSSNRRTVVFIDHYVPFYDKDAGSRSTWMYVKAMVEAGLNVKFLPANFYPHQPYTKDLQQLGVEVLFGESYARNWKKWFQDNASCIDVIYMHRPHITEDFIDHLTNLTPQPKLIYWGCDLHYLRTLREAELYQDSSLFKLSDDWKEREFRIFEKVDKVFYLSSFEIEELKREAPHIDADAIPLYFLEQPELSEYQHENRDGLIFVGGFGHPPNEDAVLWFFKDIFPTVLKKIPSMKLHVVGSMVPDSIKELQSQNVIVHGFLPDEELVALYQEVRLSVVPLRFGAGVKGKVLEALQAGLPIVTTPIGAEGIPEADSVMSICDNAQAFADELVNLYQNEKICGDLISRYPRYIEKYFSNKAVHTIIEKNFLN